MQPASKVCNAPGWLTVPAVMLVLALICAGRLGLAQAQDGSSIADGDHRDAGSKSDPCHDPSTPNALREALSLVCARGRVESATPPRRAIIVGFVGGFAKPDDINHPEVLFATLLRNRYGAGVQVAVFGNHDEKKVLEETIHHLDTDKDGHLTAAEKEQVKIILYGHSWGASQELIFARELQRLGIPVALTIQIDSVKKFGQDDRTVPDNVAKAINFYQRKGLTPGEPLIVPIDASRTTILGNFQMKYEDRQVQCDNYRWASRVFNKPHHQIENDPHIWDKIVFLIDSELLGTHAALQASSSESPVSK